MTQGDCRKKQACHTHVEVKTIHTWSMMEITFCRSMKVTYMLFTRLVREPIATRALSAASLTSSSAWPPASFNKADTSCFEKSLHPHRKPSALPCSILSCEITMLVNKSSHSLLDRCSRIFI